MSLGKGLIYVGVVLGIALLIGYFGGMIGSGIKSIADALRALITSGGYLLALSLGAVATYMFATTRKGSTLSRKDAPLLMIIGFVIIFLWFSNKASFSVINLPIVGGVDSTVLQSAIISAAISFGLNMLVFLKTKRII